MIPFFLITIGNFICKTLTDLALVQGLGPYSNSIKKVEKEIKEMAKKVNDLCGMLLLSVLMETDMNCHDCPVPNIRRANLSECFDLYIR